MKKKIKVTAKQYAIISKIYRFGGFAIITGLLASISVLVGKPFEFLFIFLPYFISKNFYEKQYHAKSLKQCFTMSLMIFTAAIIFVLPTKISMTFSVMIGSGIAYISYKAGTIQYKLRDYDYIEPRYNQLVDFYKNATEQKPFDVNACTEEELRKRCAELHFSYDNTELAVEFFIKKTKQSVIADRLCIDEKSVTTRKKRLKAKLQQICD